MFFLFPDKNIFVVFEPVLCNQFFTCVALAKAGLVVGPLRPSGRPSVRLSIRPKHFRVPSLCNL